MFMNQGVQLLSCCLPVYYSVVFILQLFLQVQAGGTERHPAASPKCGKPAPALGDTLAPTVNEEPVFDPVRFAAEKDRERVAKAATDAAIHGAKRRGAAVVAPHAIISPQDLAVRLMPRKNKVSSLFQALCNSLSVTIIRLLRKALIARSHQAVLSSCVVEPRQL